jgi:hypothetical protein
LPLVLQAAQLVCYPSLATRQKTPWQFGFSPGKNREKAAIKSGLFGLKNIHGLSPATSAMADLAARPDHSELH